MLELYVLARGERGPRRERSPKGVLITTTLTRGVGISPRYRYMHTSANLFGTVIFSQ